MNIVTIGTLIVCVCAICIHRQITYNLAFAMAPQFLLNWLINVYLFYMLIVQSVITMIKFDNQFYVYMFVQIMVWFY